MSRALLGIALVGLAPLLQGVLAAFVPPPYCPDLGLLVIVAIGFFARGAAGGLCVAALLGFLTDLLSGSLLGQHVLLRLAAFGAAHFASQHLNLRGARAQAVFVAGLSVANGLATGSLTAFFSSQSGLGLPSPGELAVHAAVNALCAPIVAVVAQRVVSALSPEESGRRLLRLEPRNWAA